MGKKSKFGRYSRRLTVTYQVLLLLSHLFPHQPPLSADRKKVWMADDSAHHHSAPVLVAALTPILAGQQLPDMLAFYPDYTFISLAGMVGFLWIVIRLITALSTHRERRWWVSRFRRLTRWEFWPPYLFYPPVVIYAIYLGARYRSWTPFTAANPAIPAGGVIGESKSAILNGLHDSSEFIARYQLIPNGPLSNKRECIRAFMTANDLDFPIVLKPDRGERGDGVLIAKNWTEVERYLDESGSDTIVQEYVPGHEFGIFYYRYPSASKGQLFSITDKRLLSLIGDGRSTLERLILDDDRAVCMARFHLKNQADRLDRVLPSGENYPLVTVGTHCRGALFLDGWTIKTEALEQVIDHISRKFDGFYFGRYDIRTPSIEDFQKGRNFKIVELNGVTSEAAHIYDPKYRLWTAYRVLFRQWRVAYEIGLENMARGHRALRLMEFVRLILRKSANNSGKISKKRIFDVL